MGWGLALGPTELAAIVNFLSLKLLVRLNSMFGWLWRQNKCAFDGCLFGELELRTPETDKIYVTEVHVDDFAPCSVSI